MITKQLVEDFTEVAALLVCFTALAVYLVFLFQDYEARKRNKRHKGR